MLYTRFGGKCRIVGNLGEHKVPPRKAVAVPLLKMEWLDDETEKPTGRNFYYFSAFLKATNGLSEIEEGIKAAPVITLKGPELKQAIRKAL